MRLFILARYHARAGHESAVEAALRDVTGPTREERGCLSETPTFPGLQARGWPAAYFAVPRTCAAGNRSFTRCNPRKDDYLTCCEVPG
jgi:hypothetical protein